MIGSLNALFAATVVFVGGHFLLSSANLRPRLLSRLGPQGFRAAYSLFALVSFVWMLMAYGEAPGDLLWSPPEALRWVPLLIMPLAAILLVCGVTSRSPTMVGGEDGLRDAPASFDPAPGILRVTRHPVLWSFVFWSASHLLVNGDVASMIMMGGILVLAGGGMGHIDQKRAVAMGSDWGPVALTTSVLPFAAILSGRTTMDWPGIGWWRPLLAIAVYAGLLHLHSAIFGVSPLPL